MKHIIIEKDTIETLNIKIGITIFINNLMEDGTEVLTTINNLIIKDGMDTEATIEKNLYRKWNRGLNYYQKSKPRRKICEICKKNHKIWECCSYNHGQEMREILQWLDRCDACLQKKQYHQNGCYNISWGERPECFYCGQTDHETITCGVSCNILDQTMV